MNPAAIAAGLLLMLAQGNGAPVENEPVPPAAAARAAHPAKAPHLGPCRLSGTTEARSLAELPPPVAAGLASFFAPRGGFADANAPFNATDVVDSANPLPSRRFLRAYGKDGRWIVWYEHGGFAYHRHATGVTIDSADGPARVDPFDRFSGYTGRHLCSASRAYFRK